MKTLITLLLLLSLSSTTSGFEYDPLSTEEILLETTLISGLFIDWGQTRNSVGEGNYHENNPVMGKNPNVSTIDTYFVGVLLLEPLVTRSLPPRVRKWWLRIMTTVQWGYVANNHYIGMRVSL